MSHGAPARKAVPLTEPKYASFLHASHCLHLDEALGALGHRRLASVRATDTTAIIRSKVLWYTLGFSNGPSMYGNVSFVADWGRVTSKLGSRLYYIDQTMGTDRCCTRLLLTRSSYEGALQEVDNVQGSPIIEKMGQPFHVVRCRNKKNCDGPHEVKLAVEADEGEAAWLFSISHVLVNDHFFVNLPIDKQCKRKDGRIQRYKQHKCCKYNSLLNALCPFQLRREDVDCKLREGCPGVVLGDIGDLTVNVDQKYGHSNVKTIKEDLSDCENNQRSPSIQQHYNCLEDPNYMLGVRKNISEQNMPKICQISDILPSAGAAASGALGARGALTCDQYHRYRPTKEDDAFQQGHMETATAAACEDMSDRTVTRPMLSCVDRSPQIRLAEGHSESADNNLVCFNNSPVWKAPSASSRTPDNTSQSNETEYINSNPYEIVEPKLEIDLMKMALDDVQCKLLKLEKALTKPSQSISPDTNSEISSGNFSNVMPKVENQDMMSKQAGPKRLSEENQTPNQNVSIDSRKPDSNPVSQYRSLEPNRDLNYARLLTDATDSNEPSDRGKSREQITASRGVTSGGQDETPSGSDKTRQRKRSSTLYKSTFSSAVKARAKGGSAAIPKNT